MKNGNKTIDPLPDSFETEEKAGAFWDAHSTMDYQEHLDIDISQLNPKEVLAEGAIEEYEVGIGFFFSELVELNTIIYLAEQILAFPFDLFVSRDEQTFFSVVMGSFYDSAVLTITRLATDQKGDLFTLLRFKSRVRDLTKPEFRDALDVRLKEARFDSEVISLLGKAKDLRDHRIGHTTKEFVSGSVALFRPNIADLRGLSDALNSLLNALAFNVEHSMLPIPYDARVLRQHQKTDIEEILDCIARDSFFLNMPERYPERWKYRRPNLNGDKLRSFNEYRRKFDLPEV